MKSALCGVGTGHGICYRIRIPGVHIAEPRAEPRGSWRYSSANGNGMPCSCAFFTEPTVVSYNKQYKTSTCHKRPYWTYLGLSHARGLPKHMHTCTQGHTQYLPSHWGSISAAASAASSRIHAFKHDSARGAYTLSPPRDAISHSWRAKTEPTRSTQEPQTPCA